MGHDQSTGIARSYGAHSRGLAAWLLSVLQVVVLLLVVAVPLQEHLYRCDGERLQAAVYAGAVDAVGIPNTLAGTPPGATVVLSWRGQTLQLPRTNNAGSPSERHVCERWTAAEA